MNEFTGMWARNQACAGLQRNCDRKNPRTEPITRDGRRGETPCFAHPFPASAWLARKLPAQAGKRDSLSGYVGAGKF